MILTRSPHYINVPINFPLTTTGVTLELYIWTGAQASPPATPNYTLTKKVPSASTSELNIDISSKIHDFLTGDLLSNATTGLIAGGNTVVWAKYDITYNDDTEIIANLSNTLLAIEGYGKYEQGGNPDYPSTNFMLDGDTFQISRTGSFCIPFLIVESEITVSEDGGTPASFPLTVTTNSTTMVGYLWINGASYTGNILTVTMGANTIRLELVDECKYTPQDVCFINKYGFQQIMPFFKEKVETLRVKDKTYRNTVINNANYTTSDHQIKTYNKTGQKSVTLTSGFYYEENNEEFEQLLLSERVWFLSNQVFTPVKVTRSSMQFKTRQNDKLVGYKVGFDYAFDTINSA